MFWLPAIEHGTKRPPKNKAEDDCPRCEGTGKQPLFTSLVDCETCRGSGRKTEK